MTISLIDWRGTEYTVGSVVVYPRMYASSVEMIEGEVIDIVTTTDYKGRPQNKVKIKPFRGSSRWYGRYGMNAKTVVITKIENISAMEGVEPLTDEQLEEVQQRLLKLSGGAR